MIRAVFGLVAAAALLCAAIVLGFDRPPLQPVRGADVEVTRGPALLSERPAEDAAALRHTAVALGALSVSRLATPADPSVAPDAPAVGGQAGTTMTTASLRNALIEAIAQGRSDAEIGALIAVARGMPGVEVPERLVTARGLLDTARFDDPGAAASHIVAPGDTLRSIADRHYGTPEAWMRIVEANAAAFARNGALAAGQVLIIPD